MMKRRILLLAAFSFFAIMLTGQGGIETNFGFDIKANVPADLRTTIATDADTANVLFKYPTMRVRSDASSTVFEWTGTKWVQGGKSYAVAAVSDLSDLDCNLGNWAYVSNDDAWYYCDGSSSWTKFSSADGNLVNDIIAYFRFDNDTNFESPTDVKPLTENTATSFNGSGITGGLLQLTGSNLDSSSYYLTSHKPQSLGFWIDYTSEDTTLIELGDATLFVRNDTLFYEVLGYPSAGFEETTHTASLPIQTGEQYISAGFVPGDKVFVRSYNGTTSTESSVSAPDYGAQLGRNLIVTPGSSTISHLVITGSKITSEQVEYLSGFSKNSFDPLVYEAITKGETWTGTTQKYPFKGGLKKRNFQKVPNDSLPLTGSYWLRPYPIHKWNPSIADTTDKYLWLTGSAHFDVGGYEDGVWYGYSNNPGVLPDSWDMLLEGSGVDSTGLSYNQLETPWLVYNPDDATDPFYLYGHAIFSGGQRTVLYKSSDLTNWEMVGRVMEVNEPTSDPDDSNTGTHTGYANVHRRGTGDWIAYSLYQGGPLSSFRSGYWTSSNGVNWTAESSLAHKYRLTDNLDNAFMHGAFFAGLPNDELTHYAAITRLNGKNIFFGKYTDSYGQHNERFNFDTRYLIDSSGTNYSFPGLEGYRFSTLYTEDGVGHIYARRGQIDEQLDEQGVDEKFVSEEIDYFTYVINPDLANYSAPIGLDAKSNLEGIQLNWMDALPHTTYRIYRSIDDVNFELIQGVIGTNFTDTKVDPNVKYYYRVKSFWSGVEGKSSEIQINYDPPIPIVGQKQGEVYYINPFALNEQGLKGREDLPFRHVYDLPNRGAGDSLLVFFQANSYEIGDLGSGAFIEWEQNADSALINVLNTQKPLDQNYYFAPGSTLNSNFINSPYAPPRPRYFEFADDGISDSTYTVNVFMPSNVTLNGPATDFLQVRDNDASVNIIGDRLNYLNTFNTNDRYSEVFGFRGNNMLLSFNSVYSEGGTILYSRDFKDNSTQTVLFKEFTFLCKDDLTREAVYFPYGNVSNDTVKNLTLTLEISKLSIENEENAAENFCGRKFQIGRGGSRSRFLNTSLIYKIDQISTDEDREVNINPTPILSGLAFDFITGQGGREARLINVDISSFEGSNFSFISDKILASKLPMGLDFENGNSSSSNYDIEIGYMENELHNISFDNIDFQDSSQVLISCNSCKSQEASIYFNQVNVDATSTIIITGLYTSEGSKPVLVFDDIIDDNGGKVILKNVVLKNDGTVPAIQSNGPITVYVSGAFDMNSIIKDPDVTFIRLDEYGLNAQAISYENAETPDSNTVAAGMNDLYGRVVPDTLIRQYKLDLSSTADTIQNLATYVFEAITDQAVGDRIVAALEVNTADTVGTDFHFTVQDQGFTNILPSLAGNAFELEAGQSTKRWYAGTSPMSGTSLAFDTGDVPQLNVANGSGVTGIPSYVASEGTNEIWITIYYVDP